MARYDIKVVTNGQTFAGTLNSTLPVPATASKGLKVKANTKAILAGQPVIVDGSNAGYVTTIADSAQLSSDNILIGISAGDSTQTATADGEIQVTVPVGANLYVKMQSLIKANITAAMTYLNKTVDVSAAGVATWDQGTATKGVAKLLGYDTTTGEVEALLRCNFFLA